jgi:hypothetical protein
MICAPEHRLIGEHSRPGRSALRNPLRGGEARQRHRSGPSDGLLISGITLHLDIVDILTL